MQIQWGEMTVLPVNSRPYGRPLSTVFGSFEKGTAYMLDDDNDPILNDLRTLNYRYVRLYFHPLKDKFLLCSGWKDPAWTDVRSIRAGITSDEKSHRDVVFGNNLIDIEQKSTVRLLIDEVRAFWRCVAEGALTPDCRLCTPFTSFKYQA
jgi:cation-transporting P-type ATPase 13A2